MDFPPEHAHAIRSAAWNSDPARQGLGNALTDDLLQEATVAVWKAQRARDKPLDAPLVYAIARRACIDYLRLTLGRVRTGSGRRELRRGPLSLDRALDEGVPPPSIREDWRGVNARADFDRAVRALPNWRHRAMARALVLDEEDHHAVAALTGYTVNSSRSIWNDQVRPKLRSAMRAYRA